MSRRATPGSAPTQEVQASGADRPIALETAPEAPPWGLTVAGLAGVLVLSYGALVLAPEGLEVAVWAPAAGVAVALLVLTSRRWQWMPAAGVVVATGLAHSLTGLPPELAAGIGLSHGLGAYAVALLLTWGRTGRPPLRTVEDLWRFVVATLAGTAVAAAGTGLGLAYALDASFLATALVVAASHAAAILLVTPLVLRVGPSTIADRRQELVAQVLLLLAAVGLVFAPDQAASLTFVPLPLLLWGALRFGLRVVTYEVLATGLLATGLTAVGGGPFAAGTSAGDNGETAAAVVAQTFVVVTALVTLLLAVAVDQRRSALMRMAQSEELFHKSFSESFVGMLLLSLARDGLRIREVNQTAADILGVPTEKVQDRPLEPLLETSTSLKDVAEQMRSGELAGWREELWLSHEPGRRVAFAMSPMSTEGEEPMFSAQMMDITDVYDATTRLQTEKDFTSAVLNTTACLIVVLDVEGRIVGLNPSGERLAGRSEADVLDQPLWRTIAPATEQHQLRDLLDRTRPGREPEPYEGDLLTGDGQRRRIVWSSAPLLNESGRRTHVVLTGIDVTDERNVRSMTNHLLDVATSTAFIGVNLLGTITIFNAGAQELLGYSADEVTGKLQLDALHEPDELARAAHAAGTPYGFPAIVEGVVADEHVTRNWTYVRKDGSRVACAVTMSVVRDAFGSHIGYLAVARDMTDSQRSQMLLLETIEKEREATERLRDLDRAKSDFTSMVSHEIRTPITSIVGYTEMLQDGAAGPLSREQDRLLDAVRRNGLRLIELIDDLLTLSRIDTGTFTMAREHVDLLSVFDRAHETVEPLLIGRPVDVHVDLPDSPVLVLGDPAQLQRVVVNLLSNAVKFTEDGGRVGWSLTTTGTHAQIDVTDTGIGIPEAEQPALFTRFFRSSNAQEKAIQGTGLGLTIVQSIVHAHGGDISIRSRQHVGTEVRVVLPLLPARHRIT
jgi:PAS domain S-box-containing protein